MTISKTYAPARFTGNGATTAFAFDWDFTATSDVKVYLAGVLQSSGYSVSAPGSSGTVTFSTAPASGVSVSITRDTPKTQNIDLVANDAFPASTNEGGFDRLTLAAQDLSARLNRTLRVADYAADINPIADPTSPVISWADLPLNLKTYGAKGDGVTDDTAAINAWVTELVSRGAVGYAPAGNYRFTSAMTWPAGSLPWGIVADGSATVTFTYAGANASNDIITIGDGTTDLIRRIFSGFTLRSSTTMTAGIGIHIKRLCRSLVYDVVADGQDGNGNLWHGIRYNGLDNVFFDRFEVRAQKDGLQVNGLTGSNPKADLHVTNYKISSCDVGVRIGGAFGGFYSGTGSLAVCGDSFVVDTTLVAEANREVFFTPETSLDTPTRCNLVVDQSLSSQMYINVPQGMWMASSGSHCIWVKNANGAKITIDGYIYNVTGDGVRIDDANAFVQIDCAFFNNVTGYGINPTVATTKLKITAPHFESVSTPFNTTSNRLVSSLPAPLSIQSGRAVYWLNFTGTLNGSGNATITHGLGGNWYKQVIAVFASAKSSGGAWYPATAAFIDGTSISVTSSAPFASQPYNVTVLLGDQANSGW